MYDHIFCDSVKHANSHVTTPLIPCVTPSGGEKNPHTAWHALPVHSSHHGGWHPMPNKGPRLSPWMHTSINLSPCLRSTQAWQSLWNKVKRDSSPKTQRLRCLRSNLLSVLPHTRRRRLWSKSQAARILFTVLPTANLHQNRRIISTRRRGAEMKRFALTIRINCLLGLWSDWLELHASLMWPTSVSVASQNFADASLRHT